MSPTRSVGVASPDGLSGPQVAVAQPTSPACASAPAMIGAAEVRTVEDVMPLAGSKQKMRDTVPALEEEIRYLRWLLDEERNIASELRTQLMEREQNEGHLRQSLAEAYETLAATVRQVSGVSPSTVQNGQAEDAAPDDAGAGAGAAAEAPKGALAAQACEEPLTTEPDIEAAARVASHIVGSAWEKAFQKLWRKWSEERSGRAA